MLFCALQISRIFWIAGVRTFAMLLIFIYPTTPITHPIAETIINPVISLIPTLRSENRFNIKAFFILHIGLAYFLFLIGLALFIFVSIISIVLSLIYFFEQDKPLGIFHYKKWFNLRNPACCFDKVMFKTS
jgi:hypothetical protein